MLVAFIINGFEYRITFNMYIGMLLVLVVCVGAMGARYFYAPRIPKGLLLFILLLATIANILYLLPTRKLEKFFALLGQKVVSAPLGKGEKYIFYF